MSATVPTHALVSSRSGIENGTAVRGSTWLVAAQQANRLNGTGSALVPAFDPKSYVAAGTTNTFYFRVRPRRTPTARVWSIVLVRNANDDSSLATVTIGSLVTVVGVRSDWKPTRIFEQVVNPVDTTRTISIAIECPARKDAFYVRGIACHEVSRSELEQNTDDYGVAIETLGPGEPIYDDTGKSFGWLATCVQQHRARARKGSLFQWATDTADAISVTSGTYVALFACDPPLLNRLVSIGDVASFVRVAADVETDGSSTGKVQFTMTSGDSVELSVAASAAWGDWVSSKSLSVDAEDLSTSDGRRSSRTDLCTMKVKRTAGTSFKLRSISIFDDGP